MSLINEALKKAQRMRTEDAAGTASPLPGGAGRVAKRGQAKSSQTIVLIASGAAVLVVLSVVGTFWLLNRPAPPAPAKAVASAPPASAPGEPTTPLVPPVITPTPAATTTAPAPHADTTAATEPKKSDAAPASEVKPAAPSLAASRSAPAAPVSESITSPAAVNQAANAASGEAAAALPPTVANTGGSAPAATTAAASAAAKPDERIASYVDALRVTAIRASANDSKVFMNDRVYRVNDLVERTLGIKLIKVAPDSLTFSDPNGVTYVKYF